MEQIKVNKNLLKKAQEGDTESIYKLAKQYYAGKGVKQDYYKARELMAQASEDGDYNAQYEYALMCVSGLGGDEDVATAFEMFKKASDSGFGKAKFELGAMYASGNGVKKNYVKAMKLLRECGTYEAAALLDDAPTWWEAPAKQGIPEAMFQLGLCYTNAYGFQTDYVTGRYWLLKAAFENNAKACYALAQIYEGGIGVDKNQEKANYFKKCYCDIKMLDYLENGVTGDEVNNFDDLDPDKMQLPVYEVTE